MKLISHMPRAIRREYSRGFSLFMKEDWLPDTDLLPGGVLMQGRTIVMPIDWGCHCREDVRKEYILHCNNGDNKFSISLEFVLEIANDHGVPLWGFRS